MKNNLKIWIGLIVVSNIAIHLAFYNTLGFHRDELLYFSLGENPSAGYASVPPFTGIMAWLMINLAGSNLFSARLLPAIFSGLLILLACGIVKELKGGELCPDPCSDRNLSHANQSSRILTLPTCFFRCLFLDTGFLDPPQMDQYRK